jgi:hypothetical protein
MLVLCGFALRFLKFLYLSVKKLICESYPYFDKKFFSFKLKIKIYLFKKAIAAETIDFYFFLWYNKTKR